MATYAYTTVPGKLKDLLAKTRETGVPPRATQTWLASVGFKSKNDRTMLAILRQIGFTDDSGAPTDLWRRYRGADHARVLAAGLRRGYGELFEIYPDAQARSAPELEDFFTTRSSAGKQVVGKMIGTFKNLAQMADFEGAAPEVVPTQHEPDLPREASTAQRVVASSSRGAGAITINVNVQLVLPETTDEEVYERFFAAMRKHLLAESDA
jgi:hypothetical protein